MNPRITAAEAASILGLSVQAIHKQLKSKNLECSKSQNRVYFGHETARNLFEFKFTPQIISFQIVKGGTGKTSIALSFSVRANLYGARVLCIDLDQQGNLTQALQVDAENKPVLIDVIKQRLDIEDSIVPVSPGLDLIPSRIENAVLDNLLMLERHPLHTVFKESLEKLKRKYDVIVIDCPPALGQAVAAITLASDLIIAPVTPEEFSLSGLKISFEEIKEMEKKYGTKIPFKLILNKFDTRTTLSHEILTTLIKHPIYGERLFKSYIRSSQEFPNTISASQSIFDTLKSNSAKEDIDLFTREALNISFGDKK